MVLTANQTRAFFEHADQMGIPAATVTQMEAEGITTVSDLADFDKDSLQQLADNLRRPGGRVPDPNPAAPQGATIPTPPFTFGAKAQKRLQVATDLIKFYDVIGRDLTAANIQWNPIMRNFEIQWKALKAKKEEDEPEVPKITRALPVIKWTEAFQDHLNRIIGVRIVPLKYVIRPTAQVPAEVPPLATNQPHSEAHGSVEEDLVARASHTHALFRDDNSKVYHLLEEATRSTQYAASIKPYQRTKNGRGAWLAMVKQYAGEDKWEAEIKRQEQLLHTRVWKGQSNFSLEAFVSQHRNAYVSMQACAEHVAFQLPNGHSRVGFLLDAIQCSDAGLQASMANIRTDKAPGGMRSDFEAAAAHLLPYDPVAKKRTAANKRGIGLISATDADISATSASGKPGIGQTGVHLRFHTKSEYQALTSEQKTELKQWRLDNPDKVKASKATKRQRTKSYTQKQISSLVTKKVKAELEKESEEKKETDDLKAYIMSVIREAVPTARPATATANASSATGGVTLPPPPPANLKPPPVPGALRSILKRSTK